MARKKRTLLPRVLPHHAARSDVRPTPNGGWAWKCHYCGQYASSETQAGRFVCRRHGGVTPRQRDPLLRLHAYERNGKWPRRPGRPLKHGLRSRGEHVRVADVVRTFERRRSAEAHQLRQRIARML